MQTCSRNGRLFVLTGDGLRNGASAPRQSVVSVVVARTVASRREPVLYLTRVVQRLAADQVVYRVVGHHYLRRRRALVGGYQLRGIFNPRSRFLEKFDTGNDRHYRVVLEQVCEPLVSRVTADRYASIFEDRTRGKKSTPRL